MEEKYIEKSKDYFTNARMDIIKVVPQNSNNKILEIGAGGGNTLITLKELKKANEIVGVELIKLRDSYQNSPIINKFIIGNIENIELDLQKDYFDVIICGDVLEHLFDPWAVVEKLTVFLKPGGIFIASLPNIRNFVPMFKILILADLNTTRIMVFWIKHIYDFSVKKILLNFLKLHPYNLLSVFNPIN